MRNIATVIEPGFYTTVQDYPGRVGRAAFGVPRSGPMDDYAFRIGNALLGNQENAPGLECTFGGPVLRFSDAARICLTGAMFPAFMDDQRVPYWQVITIKPNSLLHFNSKQVSGSRLYILIDGGFEAPLYMGSASTFCLADLGGLRALQSGDRLQYRHVQWNVLSKERIEDNLRPQYGDHWQLRVRPGPHAGGAYMSESFLNTLAHEQWRVHNDSNRCGIRLEGETPEWQHFDPDAVVPHPSGIQDTPYVPGTIILAGNTPIILGPDGPTLGGFISLATVIEDDRWKLGQMRPNDVVEFRAPEGMQLWETGIEESIPEPGRVTNKEVSLGSSSVAVPDHRHELKRPQISSIGDSSLLIEYGTDRINITDRVRIHVLAREIESSDLSGITDIVPGICSLLLQYDNTRLTDRDLHDLVREKEPTIEPDKEVIPNRTVHMPLVWNDSLIRLAIERYTRSFHTDAPWLPSNIEYLWRVNRLSGEDELRHIVYNTSYLVLALGDVYMGAPVAVPMHAEQRLLADKYNPPRSWTPEGCVGLGGTNLCIYSTPSPGGYQLIGRTVPVWDFSSPCNRDEYPGLLRFFDVIRFYEIDSLGSGDDETFSQMIDELVRIEPSIFRLDQCDPTDSSTVI